MVYVYNKYKSSSVIILVSERNAITVIVLGNEPDKPSSNPGQSCCISHLHLQLY